MRAEALRLQWNFGAAGEWADRALAAAEKAGSLRLKGEALLSQVHIARQQGDAARAEGLCQAALRCFRELDDPRGLGKIHLALAIVMRTQGQTTGALGNYERALSDFMETDDAVSVARCRQGMANLHRGLGRYRRALGLYQAALSVFEAEGVRNEATLSRIGIAEVARFQGRLLEAEQAYREALALQRSMGDRSLSITRCNLALVGLAQGEFEAARAQLELAETEMLQAGQKGTLVYVHTLQLPCIASAGEKALWDRQVPIVRQEIESTRTVDTDLAKAAEQAGDLRSELERGGRSRYNSSRHWKTGKAWDAWRADSPQVCDCPNEHLESICRLLVLNGKPILTRKPHENLLHSLDCRLPLGWLRHV
jgi:tetratricopeptide (TPR) repeat protein